MQLAYTAHDLQSHAGGEDPLNHQIVQVARDAVTVGEDSQMFAVRLRLGELQGECRVAAERRGHLDVELVEPRVVVLVTDHQRAQRALTGHERHHHERSDRERVEDGEPGQPSVLGRVVDHHRPPGRRHLAEQVGLVQPDDPAAHVVGHCAVAGGDHDRLLVRAHLDPRHVGVGNLPRATRSSASAGSAASSADVISADADNQACRRRESS